jgi:hypothetical protein
MDGRRSPRQYPRRADVQVVVTRDLAQHDITNFQHGGIDWHAVRH